MTSSPQNLVIIITDQQRAPAAFGAENRAKMTLPAMDRLAARGMEFTNATCNTCMCSPSRSTLMTGRYPAQHGVTQTLTYGGVFSPSQPTLDPETPNIGNIFAKAGYDTQYRGKWHLSKNPTLPDDPNALNHADVALFGFRGWQEPDAGMDAEATSFGGGWPNADAKYVAEARQFIQDREASKHKRPFVLVLSLVNPHDCLAYPTKWQYGYTKEDYLRTPETRLSLPDSYDEDLSTNKKPAAQAQLKVTMAASLGVLGNKKEQENYLNFYATLCEQVDKEINAFLDLFYESDGTTPNDLFNDTVILRISDHGEMGMAHGGLRQKAFNVYEETLRVPMIWAAPALFDGPKSTTALASLVDVLPTAIGLMGIKHLSKEDRAALKGVDLSPVLRGESTETQDQILFTYDDIRASSGDKESVVAAPDRIRCVRTETWKYAEYTRANSTYAPQYELYDLTAPTSGNPEGQNGLEYDNLFYGDDGRITKDPGTLKQIATMQALLANQIAEKLEVPTDPSP